jgi:CheY-like chemotaxis protein
MLARLGITADLVESGQQVVDRAGVLHYDAILMDCKMPGVDGYEATRRIRARQRPGESIPIVAVTAGVLPEDRQTCLAAGMTAVLAKPLEQASLQQTLAQVLAPRPR